METRRLSRDKLYEVYLLGAKDMFSPFYRSYAKIKQLPRKHIILDRDELMKCHSMIWKAVRKHYLEDEGGVYIHNLGYLCHFIRGWQKFYVNNLSRRIQRRETNGYSYLHFCYDFFPVNQFFHLYLDKILINNAIRKMANGTKYKFLYREVSSEREVFNSKPLRLK